MVVLANASYATVNITDPPMASRTVCSGVSVTFKIVATGSATLTYQWKKGGVNIPGATGSTYTIASVATTDAGSYTCTVSDGVPTTSTASVLAVNATPAAPTVTTPVNYCQNATATQLTATGSNLAWGNTVITSGSIGGTAALATTTWIDGRYQPSGNRLFFTTTKNNVKITTVDYFVPPYQAVTGLVLGIYDAAGTIVATSSTTTTTVTPVGTSTKITSTFNYTIPVAGSYSIGASAGYGNIGGDLPTYPITEGSGTINVTSHSSGGYRCFNNIQFSVSSAPSAPTPSTTTIGTTNYPVTQTLNGCISPAANIAVVVSAGPTTANAGVDQTGAATCGLTSVTLAGNTPTAGTGAWSIVSGTGGTIATPTSPTSTFTGTAGTAYTLKWTITNSCASSSDNVLVTFNRAPTTANAGPDQTGAATCGVTTVTLAGNTPSVGTGTWSIVSGAGGTITTPTSPTSTFTGVAGTTYTLRWTVSNSPCTASTDDVVITFNRAPTTANAGTDQTGAATCGLTTVTLAANTPSIGTGTWSIVSGAGGTVTTPTSPTSTFTGTAGTTYTLRWTISNAPCIASTDDVIITFNRNPTTANAGPDQTGAATCGLTTVTLAANTPTIGTGAWTIVSGAGGTITTPTSPTSTFTGTAGTTYTLRWTIANSPCTASTDDVVITFNRNPTTANAGPDQTGAATCGLTNVTLAANTPTAGTGTWTIVSGAGGTVTTPNSPTSTFTGTAGTTYTLRWTISNAPCTASTDDVVITFSQNPGAATISYVGSPYCSNAGIATVTTTGTLGGTYSSTAGLSINPATGDVTLASSTPGTYTVTYTLVNGSCTTTATAAIAITAAPSAAISYSGTPYCSSSGTATVTRVGTAGGTYSSTAGLSLNSATGDITLATSAAGTYTVTYTIAAAGGCAAFSTTTTVTVTAQPNTSGYYAGNPYCTNGGIAYPTGAGTGGGVITSTAGLVINSSTGVVTLASSTPGTYTVTYTVAPSGGCALYTATTSITINPAPSATINYGATSFCKTAGNTATPVITGTTGGTFSSTAGLVINATTGVVDVGASTPGTYTISYLSTLGTCSATATKSLTVVASPSATISYAASPYCPNGTATVTRTGTAGGTYSSTAGLIINAATGDINLLLSTPGTYTVTYSILAGTCAAYSTTCSVTISNAATWTGGVSSSWSDAANWACGVVPLTTADISIPSGLARYPVVPAATTVAVKNISVTGSLTVIGSLQIAGSITAAAGSIVADSGSIEMNGITPQTISGTIFVKELCNLIINNAAGTTLSGPLKLNDVLSVRLGALNTGGYLTLASSIYGTARIGAITSPAAKPIVGNVTVERYIPGRRKYRLMTSPVTSSTTATLAPGQEGLSIWGNWQNSGLTTPNVGTIITGGTLVDGFDQATTNASMFTYNDATKKYVGFTSANGKSTKYTPLKAGVGYYFFVYGDRVNSIVSTMPNATVLKQTGTVLTGKQVYDTTSAVRISPVPGRYSLIGNPYACTIDWKSVKKSGISKTTWGWEVNVSSTGGYVTVTETVVGVFVSPLSNIVGVSRYIQPGQAFFVLTTDVNPSLEIDEVNKIDDKLNINNNVFKTTDVNTQPLMAVNLLYKNGATTVLNDGALIAFDSSFSNGVNADDGLKFIGTAEGIATSVDTTLLSINTRKLPVANDTIKLNISRLVNPQYTLQIFANKLAGLSVQPFLLDAYLDKTIPLSLTDTNNINFTINTADAASTDAGRFKIIFRANTTLAANAITISAAKKEQDVAVKWEMASEADIEKYVVQRSTDGVSFTTLAEVAAKANYSSAASYSWLDTDAAAGNNFYRVKSIQRNGNFTLSNVVLVKVDVQAADIKVVPNPIKNGLINLQVTNIAKGRYYVQVFDSYGHRVVSQPVEYKGGTSKYAIPIDAALPAGLYYLRMLNDVNIYNQTVIIQL